MRVIIKWKNAIMETLPQLTGSTFSQVFQAAIERPERVLIEKDSKSGFKDYLACLDKMMDFDT